MSEAQAQAKVGRGAVEIRGVSRIYEEASGQKFIALKEIDLELAPGSFVSFIGPSGCGKTTLMRLIAGLDDCTTGEITLDGARIQGTHYERGYVFQQANLFPWMNIRQNIAAGLKARRVYQQNRKKPDEYLELVGLSGFGNAYPHQVSGGMAQRASLARALINEPKVLMLDEPLGALDAFTRMNLQDELLRLWRLRGTTMILVTHDVDEAVYLSGRIVVMSSRPGQIKEIVEVGMAHPRDRNSQEFIHLRSRILETLHFAGSSKSLEYYL
ncbi:ABC transporter ATP-binding protein [Paenibacillus riograndensis]|uniref:Aliphatic sulfonates import ATP-binding protein SsuB n=1 Tax=Paenibacillus riograndensis SBR5 TaxID=1073571 RepID=A0A0E4HCD9_9BACL|nr:ABC transporter ATP-binding protein [Paenibacillus riograndensis]CQR56306.1 Aliphatic sulfonates import ATP-binding protein SsuB [Paenibacillus riograndensis SBR5]